MSEGMNWKIELIHLPVTDVDRAKEFYVRIGFNTDHDHTVTEELRFVQLTPPGSACSIAFGKGLVDMAPGSQQGVQVAACGQRLREGGVGLQDLRRQRIELRVHGRP